MHHYLEQLVPGEAGPIMEQVAQFFGHRRTLGWMIGETLLFLSSLAFGVLEKLMVSDIRLFGRE